MVGEIGIFTTATDAEGIFVSLVRLRSTSPAVNNLAQTPDIVDLRPGALQGKQKWLT